MFGFQGGQSVETVARKRAYMAEAQGNWPFLTTIDCRSLKNTDQLTAMIRVRAGLSDQQAKLDVETWADGKDFSSVDACTAHPTEGVS